MKSTGTTVLMVPLLLLALLPYPASAFYSPQTGRWLNRDPLGDPGFHAAMGSHARVPTAAPNPHAAVRNSPINHLDPFGLYEYEWESKFNASEKKALLDSIDRVKNRAKVLVTQMDNNIQNLSKCQCAGYQSLAAKLQGLKKVLEGMVKEISDPGWNLEMYKKSMSGVDATYWDSSVPWFDDELTINPNWFGQTAVSQDGTMFHEISHGQKTEDERVNDYNNAHLIESLMSIDKENWIIFRSDKKEADRRCNHGVP